MTEEEKVALDKHFAGLRALQEVEDLRGILATYGGRSFVWSLLADCGVYADTHRGEHTHDAAYVSGKRAIGLSLIEKVFTADPNAYTVMRLESSDRAKLEQERRAKQGQEN